MQHHKRILFLINKFGVGGAEGVFAKEIKGLIAMGLDVRVGVLFGDLSDQVMLHDLKIDGSKIFLARAQSVFDLRSLRRLIKFLANNQITNIYSTLNEANLWARFSKLFYWPARVVIREANVADHKPIKFKIADFLLNFLVAKIVCVSEEVKLSLLRYQPLWSFKMAILMNGVEIPPDPKVYPESPRLPLRILNVGSLTPKKGQRTLITALAQVNQQLPNSVKLTIVGSGSEQQNLLDLTRLLGLERVVTLIPAVPTGQIGEFYRQADLFVLSSVWEGCPNVLLEAMAYGLAVITTNVSGSRQIVGDKGIVVPVNSVVDLAQAITELVGKREILGNLGQASRERMMELFSFPDHFKKLVAIIF